MSHLHEDHLSAHAFDRYGTEPGGYPDAGDPERPHPKGSMRVVRCDCPNISNLLGPGETCDDCGKTHPATPKGGDPSGRARGSVRASPAARCPDCGPYCPECEEQLVRVGSEVRCGCPRPRKGGSDGTV